METADIPLSEIRVELKRSRKKAEFVEMMDSIGELGQWVPAKVRRLPNAKGRVKYELYSGQGRWEAAKQLGQKTLMCIIENPTEEQMAGEYLGANMLRRTQTWAENGKAMRALTKAGKTIEQVAAELHVTPPYVKKCLQVLDKGAAGLEDEIGKLSFDDAFALTTLPENGQDIVLRIAEREQQPVRDVVREAKRIMPEGHDWSLKDLKTALAKMKTDAENAMDKVKVLRLHDQLGPQQFDRLCEDKKFVAACKKAGVSLE